MVDFSVLKAPNYLELYQTSFDNGKARAKEGAVENVLKTSMGDLVSAEKDLLSMGAFDEAQKLRTIRLDQARQRAANAARNLNFDEAATAMAETGDVAGAQSMAQQGRARTLGQQVAGGDMAGARTSALQSGDFDMADAIGKLSDAEKVQAAERADTIAAIAQKLRASTPYEQRKAAIQSIAPALLQRRFSQEQVDGFVNADPTDANLDAAIASAMSLKESLAATKPQYRAVGDGGVVFDDTTGKPVFENKKNFAPPRAAGGSGKRGADQMSDAELLAIATGGAAQ